MSRSSTTTDALRAVTRLPRNRPPVHPGEMLREEFLTPMGMTQTDLASNWDLWHALRSAEAADIERIEPVET